MEDFIYYTPTKVYFGKSQEKKLGSILKEYHIHSVLLHYGMSSIKKSGLYDVIIDELKSNGITYYELSGVEPNPKLSLVEKGIEIVKNNHIELILAVGGGSVIDSAKAISVGSMVDYSPWRFSIKEKTPTCHLPVGVILTIAASGSDMSNSCVITNEKTKEKRGYNSEHNYPLFSILNPEITYTVNPYQTACGIVDILMHTLERYFSKTPSTPITDNIALGLMKSVIDAGKIVMKDPTNYEARSTLLWANSLSHNGLTSCGRNFVMSVHQLEHEISGMYDHVAHGAGLAVLWPAWAKLAYTASIERFSTFAHNVMGVEQTNNQKEDALKGIEKLKVFFKEIGMPTSMKELEIPEAKFKELAFNFTFNGTRIIEDIITVDEKMAYQILLETNKN